MIIRKFISSLSNKEKGELIRALADVSYKGKGIVFDYLYELATFIEREPDKVEPKEEPKYRYKSRSLDLPAIELTNEEKRLIVDGQVERARRTVRERTAQRNSAIVEAISKYQRDIEPDMPSSWQLGNANTRYGTITAADIAIEPRFSDLTIEQKEHVKALAAANVITAIKYMRDELGYRSMGLKAIKDYVEGL